MLASAGEFEMEPLVVAASVDVILQHKVITLHCSTLLSLEDVQQVSTLEVRVEY
jgi:hypothetical protein